MSFEIPANPTGKDMRLQINSNFNYCLTLGFGKTPPNNPPIGCVWVDTNNNPYVFRMFLDRWIEIFEIKENLLQSYLFSCKSIKDFLTIDKDINFVFFNGFIYKKTNESDLDVDNDNIIAGNGVFWVKIQNSGGSGGNDPRIGNLADLTTEHKDSIVGAINEVNAKASVKSSIDFSLGGDGSLSLNLAPIDNIWYMPAGTKYLSNDVVDLIRKSLNIVKIVANPEFENLGSLQIDEKSDLEILDLSQSKVTQIPSNFLDYSESDEALNFKEIILPDCITELGNDSLRQVKNGIKINNLDKVTRFGDYCLQYSPIVNLENGVLNLANANVINNNSFEAKTTDDSYIEELIVNPACVRIDREAFKNQLIKKPVKLGKDTRYSSTSFHESVEVIGGIKV